MKGKFLSAKWKIPVCLMLIAFGTFIAVMFGIWGVEAIKTDGGAAAMVFCFGFALFGLLFGCYSIVVFNHNRGAYLEADEQGIRAHLGFGEDISINTEEIIAAEAYGVTLSIYTESKIYIIGGLVNAFEMENYILAVAKPHVFLADAKKIQADHTTARKKFMVFFVLTCVFIFLMFAHIGWCVWLTGGRDIAEFTTRDEQVFCAFAAIEALTSILALFFAGKAGKYNIMYKHCRALACAHLAYEHRQRWWPQNALDVLYFHDLSHRVVISRAEERFAYMLEGYDAEGEMWKPCYAEAYTFESSEALYADISTRFYDVILERIE